MSLPFRLHVLAEDDLAAAWEWYEAKGRGLGDRFIDAVHHSIEQLTVWPNSGSPTTEVDGQVMERRVSPPGFPYTVRYRIVDETIVITAVHHQRRHPDYGASRKP